MPADTSVKYFHSGMTGAPQLTATAGSFLAVLDACLVNGFGTGTVDSIVVDNNVATVTRNSGHPFEVDTVALISGATPAGLNGEKKVLSVTTTTYTFETSGITNQTATGTITHKLAPLGWEKAFSSTNKAAYRSTVLTGTGCYLRIDDSQAEVMRVRGYMSMTDVDSGSDMFPSTSQIADNSYTWAKAYSTGNHPWAIVGDGKLFYVHNNYYFAGGAQYYNAPFFGDFVSRRTGDPSACIVTGENSTGTIINGGNNRTANVMRLGSTSGAYAAKNVTGVGSPSVIYRYPNSVVSPSHSVLMSGRDYSTAYPNTADNSIVLGELFVVEASPYHLRGRIPGFYNIHQNVVNLFARLDKVSGVIGYPGRKFLVFRDDYGVGLFDITGPWE